MKKKSTIFFVASIILVLIGFCGVIAGISGDVIPAWATIAMVVGGITFWLWLVALTAETVTTTKANQQDTAIKEAREANAERQAVNRQYELLESPETTYNFEVEDFHTYHVGEDCVLVHNSCAHKSSSWKKQKYDYRKSHQNDVSDLYELSPSNQSLMAKGKAPIGYDGYRIELHHVSGINNSSVITPMTKASHTILHKFVGYKNMIDYVLRR